LQSVKILSGQGISNKMFFAWIVENFGIVLVYVRLPSFYFGVCVLVSYRECEWLVISENVNFPGPI